MPTHEIKVHPHQLLLHCTLKVCLMQGLDHAHVLVFHEWYETPKHIWMITELANGGTLADILEQDGYLPFPQVVDFMRDIASGLSYVHSRQIVYCDLQPHKVAR